MHMAKQRRSVGMKKINGIFKFEIIIEKIVRKSIFPSKKSCSSPYTDEYEENFVDPTESFVPKDVKEGHFAVIAVDVDEPRQRFAVPLSFLTHPKFLELQEQAAEEYGFDHEGALMVPCRPSELEMIWTDQQWQEQGDYE